MAKRTFVEVREMKQIAETAAREGKSIRKVLAEQRFCGRHASSLRAERKMEEKARRAAERAALRREVARFEDWADCFRERPVPTKRRAIRAANAFVFPSGDVRVAFY